MDIYTAEIAAAKLVKFITNFSNQNRNMYEKTQVRLSNLKLQADRISDTITTILRNTDYKSEFNTSSIQSLDDAVSTIFKLQQFIHQYSQENSADSDQLRFLLEMCRSIYVTYGVSEDDFLNTDEFQMQMVLDKIDSLRNQISGSAINREQPEESATSTKVVDGIEEESVQPTPSLDRRKAWALYHKAFEALRKSDIRYTTATRLKDLICDWFEIRFTANFKYKLSAFSSWVVAIVTSYAYSIQKGTTKQYLASFRNWLNVIQTTPDGYSLPFDIYQFYKDPPTDLAVCAAYILYDILYDAGLKIAHAENPFCLSEDCLTSWAVTHHIQNDPAYNYYKSQPDIVAEYKIV